MYLPCVSSAFKKDEYRYKIKKKLENVLEDLESFDYWDETYSSECDIEKEKDYEELKKLVCKILNKGWVFWIMRY